jgi:hypothetical protein
MNSGEETLWYNLLNIRYMKSICVFCGSSRGIKDIYSEQAEKLADALVAKNMKLVYGGANIGLMKSIADRVLQLGGKVSGVMPRGLAQKEILHEGMTETILVEDMQERKKIMEELSDAFITMPGGFGTIDELFEILSWNQLGLIHKPVGIYNIDHYFDSLIEWLDHAVEMKFVRPEHRANILVDSDPALLIDKMNGYQGLVAEKWVDRLKEKGY